MKRELTLQIDGKNVLVTVFREGETIVVERDGERHEVVVVGDRAIGAEANAGRSPADGGSAARDPNGGAPDGSGAPSLNGGASGGSGPGAAAMSDASPAAGSAAGGGPGGPGQGDVRAPMVGVIREIHVAVGAAVTKGERLITMEAMKMDIFVNAPASGTIAALHCRAGETTTEGAVLATVSPAAAEATTP